MPSTVDISRALAIDGWMSEEELLWLASVASQSFRCVEIGTYLGRSARAIADSLPALDGLSGCLYCVDPYKLFDDPVLGGKSQVELQQIHEQAQDNLADLRQCYQLVMLCETSASAIRHFADSSLDFVFIDGEHTYEAVKQDISLWLPKVRRGGLIAGHDYGVYRSVTDAVDEAFLTSHMGTSDNVKIGAVGSIWAVRIGA